jgi:hypothetical protein
MFGGGIIAGIAKSFFGIFGKTLVDLKNTEANRQDNEDGHGEKLAGSVIGAHASAGAQRAGVQEKQGTWGPFGIIGFSLGLIICFYASQIVLDSVAWHPGVTLKYYVVPWLEWLPHKPGSWKVAALPPKWEDAVIEIVKALFYVGPPSTAAVIVAKAFRR